MSAVLLAAMIVGVASTGADVVTLRDGGGDLSGVIQASDDSALRIETPDGERRQVPWDMVRSIRFESPDAEPSSMADRLQRAQEIWRARSRLQRGDAALAEPIFERLFVASPERRGETDLVIAEGLLRCRLNRGAVMEAYLPALETARLRRLGVSTDRYDDLVPVYDETTSLCIYLAPPWFDHASTKRLVQQLENWQPGGDEELASIASQYRILVEHDGDLIPVEVEPAGDAGEAPSGNGPSGPKLLDLAVKSRSESSATRRTGQEGIRQQLARRDDWQQPLLRYFLGTSLLLEQGDGLRRQGLVELAWLPARHGTKHPYLAGAALAIMARELAAQGDLAAATRLEAELRRRYPNHPANRTGVESGVSAGKETQPR